MIKAVVGKKTYDVWMEMLKVLVPYGRTHRLSVVIASMLLYAQDIANQKANNNSKAEELSDIFESAYDKSVEDDIEDLLSMAESIMKDAGVKFKRTSRRGQGCSVAEEAVYEFLKWEDMPWES